MIKGLCKKMLSLVCAAIMITAAQTNISAEAVVPEIRALSTVCTENTVSVRLWLNNNTGISSLRFNVEYSSKLTLLSVTDGGILGEYHHSDNFSSPYTLYWANDTENREFTSDGVLAELLFSVSDSVADGEQLFVTPVFEKGNDNSLDSNLSSVELKAFSGTVTVEKKGDSLNLPFGYSISGSTLSVSGVDNGITELTVGSSYISGDVSYTVDKIADYAFADCKELKKIELPDTVKHIGTGAFLACTAIEYIDIPDNVEFIAEDAFLGCTAELFCQPDTTAQKTLKETGIAYNIYGDLYEDKVIDALDLTEMQKRLLLNKEVNEKTADIKNDGKINILDFIRLKKVLIG